METLWFALLTFLLAGYTVFDGFDLGVGAVHLLAAKTEEERGIAIASIGPVWDGNEVWIVAAGGTLFFAFPDLFAASLSGFYLPMMIFLWLIILRGISIELRGHIHHPLWSSFWDVVFAGASLLLALVLPVALACVVRGVPLDEEGRFFAPLWTDFSVGPNPGVLDWYTLLVGILGVAALSMHGALWLALKTEGALYDRSVSIAGKLWIASLVLTGLVTAATFRVQPQLRFNLEAIPLGAIIPAAAIAGLFVSRWMLKKERMLPAFLGSSGYLAGMVASAAYGIYPYVLPATTEKTRSLTIFTASSSEYSLGIAVLWWFPGILLVGLYFFNTYRKFGGKVRSAGHG